MNTLNRLFAWLSLVACTTLAVVSTASANPPPPANDNVANAQDLGTSFPVFLMGSSVLGNNSINETNLAGLVGFCDGPDVFYKLTPAANATYRFHLAPWQRAPLRSSDRRFALYVFTDLGGGNYNFIAGARAAGSALPIHLDVALNMGTEYYLGVDHNAEAFDNFDFELAVDVRNLTNPDTCASAITLSTTTPVVVLNNIDGAAHNFSFTQSTDRCSIASTATAPGIDHVYHFRPTVTGDYAIEAIATGFNTVLYVDDSCPPFFGDSCLGASDHSTGGATGGRHEFVVVSMFANTDYYIFVDNATAGAAMGSYALIIDSAVAYEVTEVEPNNSPGTASPVGTPLNGGQLVGPTDEDWWAVTGSTGDRVYAWVNNGGSANSTLDTNLGFYAADGTTLIEFDDQDGDGADAPINDLRFIYSTTAPVIAGARMTSSGTHYFRVTDTTATGTVHRYRFHVGVEPATRAPLSECEPNNTIATADRSGKHYYAGVIDTSSDTDFYAFEAVAGDRIFIAADGDPERDATGSDSANTDPNAFHAKLVIYDPVGDILISSIADSNTITNAPDYPAQGGFFVARTTGTHYVQVSPQSAASQVGPTETYNLAIFINDAAPSLAEDVDPAVTLTPDYVNDIIEGTADDTGSGVCAVTLFGHTNLQITNLGSLPAASVNFDIELVNPAQSGTGKLLITDCQGNTTCRVVTIDVVLPDIVGQTYAERTPASASAPMFVPDNQPAGPGINGTIDVADSGIISDVNVTISVESISLPDLDIFLESPIGTRVELVTDRGSSSEYDYTNTTFDDSAAAVIPLTSGAPYTGSWLTEDPLGLAKVNGENAQGTWKLNVIDDSSTNGGGARLVKWSLQIKASFTGPEQFAATVSDANGIQSISLTGATNLQLNFPRGFTQGAPSVDVLVTLIDPQSNGSGTLEVKDMQDNINTQALSLDGLPDVTAPANSGGVTRSLTFRNEVQADLPLINPNGHLHTLNVTDALLVGEVEASVTVDTKDVGRIFATLSHGGQMAALLNRTGNDERGGPGLTKDVLWVDFDDDAPVADDAHLEPALGTIPFLGEHQPDGRGEVISDGITADRRDNMLFRLAGQSAAGAWGMVVGDNRTSGFSYNTRAVFRRWSMTLKNPCGPERYVGRATDFAPGTGIDTITLDGTSTNLAIVASFTSGDQVVDYRVELVDPLQPGTGNVEISDLAAQTTVVPISLSPTSGDNNLPQVSGTLNLASDQFEGTASDNQSGDSGVAAIDLAPWSDNLQIVSITPGLPAASADFVVGLVNPANNGRGYVRVTDGCGLRSYQLVEIDARLPICSGTTARVKRYFSGALNTALPDNNAAGALTDIVVTDTGTISDLDLTFNITHHADNDIDMTFAAPVVLGLISDNGSTGNDYLDTTLDDAAANFLPTVAAGAPFTGSWKPEDGFLSTFNGLSVLNTYTLRVVDDAVNNFGSLDSWSLRISSPNFFEAYDGRAEDLATHDKGIASVTLASGANVTLTLDPAFVSGAKIARFLVTMNNTGVAGVGVVEITDGVGNVCQHEINLCGRGDTNGNGVTDINDVDSFVATLLNGPANCEADVNRDQAIDGLDVAGFVRLLVP